MAGRVVSLNVGTPPGGVTAFSLEFSADGAASYTGYYTGAGPGPEDLSTALLSGGVYVIDGLNSPTGNMQAATAEGLLYQARWKNAAGEGNWSDPFPVKTSPLGKPRVLDCLAKLDLLGARSAALVNDLSALIDAVWAEIQSPPGLAADSGGTGRRFELKNEQRTFSTVNRGGGTMALDIDEFIPPSAGGSALTVSIDGTPVTGFGYGHSGREKLPWDRLTLSGSSSIARWTPSYNVQITADWGWDLAVPADVWEGTRCEVCWRGAFQGTVPFGGISAWHDADRQVTYSPEMVKLYQDIWHGEYLRVVARYRDEQQFMDRMFQGLPGFGRR